MLTATAAFVSMSAFVKLLREDGFDTPQVMFWRMAPGLPWVLAELRVRGVAFMPHKPRLIVSRCLFGICAMATNFYAVRALTLVQHNVLHLLQPVFIAVLAPFVLGERLRPATFAALTVALIGSVAVMDPTRGLGELPLIPALAGVTAAVCSALAHMWVRRATEHDAPELLVFYFTMSVSVVTLVWGLGFGDGLTMPAGLGVPEAAWKIAGMAGFGLAGQLLMTRAYDRTQAPIVAVVAYSSIPLSFVLDALLWGATGSIATAVGALMMVLAGVLLIRGGRARSRGSKPSVRPPNAT
jgi:drug/metabolite transporter (DMT)-like permease